MGLIVNQNEIKNIYYNVDDKKVLIKNVYLNGNKVFSSSNFKKEFYIRLITPNDSTYSEQIYLDEETRNNTFNSQNMITLTSTFGYCKSQEVMENGTAYYTLEDRYGNDESTWEELCIVQITYEDYKIVGIKYNLRCTSDQPGLYSLYSVGGYNVTLTYN